jgi:hypothetical protein
VNSSLVHYGSIKKKKHFYNMLSTIRNEMKSISHQRSRSWVKS